MWPGATQSRLRRDLWRRLIEVVILAASDRPRQQQRLRPNSCTCCGAIEATAEEAEAMRAKAVADRELQEARSIEEQAAALAARAQTEQANGNAEEATKHHLKIEEAKKAREKRLEQDRYIDTMELQRVQRQMNQEQEWEQRALSQEREEDLIKTMQHKMEMSQRKKRMQVDQFLGRCSGRTARPQMVQR